ncbi:hypothetical protein [Stenotrophomonas sp.]|uniref:hypothetical protein n=1 Tax=Stenotrophomonas sp. TaxID=69392 RepID=UPI0028A70373|nr:hypothetical protein [Stenotrophomonas sp.]
MGQYDDSAAALQRLAQEALGLGANYNEATARFRLIDAILVDVLGWNKHGIAVEKFDRGDYTDYECGSPCQLLVEAKRASVSFTLPAGETGGLMQIESICATAPQVREAIEQAIGYAKSRNFPYCAVTNGKQWIFFLGARIDGRDSMKGRCVVYPSLETMVERFRELWDLVTPVAINEHSLGDLLKRESLPPPPAKLSSRIPGYPGFKNRNPIATSLQILGGLFLDDIASQPALEEQFLRTAYCQSGALSQYALVSKELLKTRYTSFFEKQVGVSAEPATGKKGTNPRLTADMLAAALSKRPILLVGDVGVGKTTFVRNLIKVDAKDELSHAFVLYVDYGTKPAISDALKDYTLLEIVRQLRDEFGVDINERQFVRGVYNQRIQEFGKGIFADLKELDPTQFKLREIEFIAGLTQNIEEHLRLSLEHASKGQKRQIVVFLDNVDQRPIAFQEEVFLIAASISANWPVTAFVSLRPETFAQSKASGALAAYQPRVFTIEPPRIDLVIGKRLEFALTQLQESGTLPGLAAGISIDSRNLELYLKMLIESFRDRSDLIEFLDNMCSGSVREALNYVGSFVGSGHVDSAKIIDAMEESGRYYLPIHEFVRAVIHKDGEYYDPSVSPIPNVFDISSADQREHFALLILLEYVEHAGQTGGSHGFVERRLVLDFMQGCGYRIEQTLSCIRRAFDKGLLISPEGTKADASAHIRITTAGAYVRKKLCGLMAYLDAIVVDTPVLDPECRGKLGDVRLLDDRLVRAEAFLDYLDSCWSNSASLSRSLDWPALSQTARHHIGEIKARAEARSSGRY